MYGKIPPKRLTRLPRHAKKFAEPIRVSPVGRRQIGVTNGIRNYVADFKAKGLKGIGLATAIVADISGFEEVALALEKAKRIWGKRSADDVIKTRKIYAMRKDEAAATGLPAMRGCADQASAVTAALRAAGFKALIVRMGCSTYTKFWYGNKVYIANARDVGRDRVRVMSRADKRLENQFRTANAFAEGASLAQIGLRSYTDFFKYRYVPKR